MLTTDFRGENYGIDPKMATREHSVRVTQLTTKEIHHIVKETGYTWRRYTWVALPVGFFFVGFAALLMTWSGYLLGCRPTLKCSTSFSMFSPVATVLTEVRKLEAQNLIPKELARRLKTTSGVSPKLCALLKIHKPNVPVRPIVWSIGSPTYQLTKYVTTLINLLTGQTSSFIMNSENFVEFVKNIHLQPSEVTVSFDIKLLFTEVPVKKAMQIIQLEL